MRPAMPFAIAAAAELSGLRAASAAKQAVNSGPSPSRGKSASTSARRSAGHHCGFAPEMSRPVAISRR